MADDKRRGAREDGDTSPQPGTRRRIIPGVSLLGGARGSGPAASGIPREDAGGRAKRDASQKFFEGRRSSPYDEPSDWEVIGDWARRVKRTDSKHGSIKGTAKSIYVLKENNDLDYTKEDMTLDNALEIVARKLGRPVATVREQLGIDQAARHTTGRAKAMPRALWESRKGEDAKLSPPEFIAKHYAGEMAAGTLHRGVIAQADKPLAVKLASWLRTHDMPEGIDIPTLPQWNTRRLENLSTLRADPVAREIHRLDQAARWRRSHPKSARL